MAVISKVLRRYRVAALSIFVTSMIAGLLSLYLSKPVVARAANMQPFSVNQVEQMMGKSHDQPDVFNSSFARRSDGSWSHTFPADPNDKSLDPVHEFIDVGQLLTVHTEPVTRSVMTRHLSLAALAEEVTAAFHSCDGSEKRPDAVHGTMLGFDVVQLVSNDPDGQEVRWVAPALDCYPLQLVDTAVDGHRHTTLVTEVRLGEPNPDRFLFPQAYVERSPSKIEELYAAKRSGEIFSERLLPTLQRRYDVGQSREQ